MRRYGLEGLEAHGADGWNGWQRAEEGLDTLRIGDDGIEEQNPGAGGDTIGNTIATTGVIVVDGAAQDGFVNTVGDDDWYAVTLTAGQSYTFTLIGGTLPDAYLQLYNSTGALIGIDDDFGPGFNSLLRWTATTSGTYYINAQGFEDVGVSNTGSYTLTAVTSVPASPLDSIDYHFTMPGPNIAIWFATTGYVNPSNDTAMRNWTQTEIDAVFAALATYSAITPLTFSQAATQGAANWVLSLVNIPGNTLGYFSPQINGYGAFDPTVANWTAGLVPGGNSFITLIHEFGHGLGLAHPHDNGPYSGGTNNSEIMQGVLDPFNSLGTFGMNSGQYTTMTYNDFFQSTPMGLDVGLLQQRYGVNPNTGSGNSSYTLALAASSYICIWDVSGTDSISYAGSGNATIDLRAATLLNAVGGGGYVSSVQGVTGGFTIANGVIIENATGGSGDDTLIGNDANNILNGGPGGDTMRGGLGDDTYYAGAFSDFADEALSAGNDTLIAALSVTLPNNVENLVLTGTATNGTGNSLNNTITGNGVVNQLNGGDGNDILIGNAGNDALDGGSGVDTAVYSLASSSATWTRNPNGTWTVSAGADGTDTVTSVDFLDFTDRDVFLDRALRTFSGNGTSDVLFRRSDGIMASWEVTGTSINSASFLPTAGAEWTPRGTGDVSGDGRDDVIWQRSDGLVYAWIMNGGTIASAVALTGVGAEWTFLGMGDFNGDLTDDFAWQRNDGIVYTWTMNNAAIASANVVTGLGAEWAFQGTGDFNSDGRDDFLWRRSDTGQTVIWQMNGSSIQSSGFTSTQAGLAWNIVGVGDTNGDGRDDILLQRASDGMIAVWAMDGLSVLSTTNIAAANPTEWAVQNVGDYNGDGRDDILWQRDDGLVYAWLLNGASIIGAGGLSGVGSEWSIIGG